MFGPITIITSGRRRVTDIDLSLPDMSQIIADTQLTTGSAIHITVIDTIISDTAATNRDRRLTTSGSRNIIDNISSTHWTHRASTIHIVHHMATINIDCGIT